MPPFPKGKQPEHLTGKKDYWTTRVRPKLDLIECWARYGLTDSQIAENLNVSPVTFEYIIEEHEELKELLNDGRNNAEAHVENAMYKTALGYSYDEVTRERVKLYDERGAWNGRYEMVETRRITKFLPGSFAAQQYILEHRMPKRWEKTPVQALDAHTVNEAIRSIADMLKNPKEERQLPGTEG